MSSDVIESVGESFVYQVASRSKAGRRYRVDITANKGAMWCACTDWSTRRQPALDRGEPRLTRNTTCKHARAALRYFCLQILPKLDKQ